MRRQAAWVREDAHPAAYARLSERPEYATGLEICRADLAEEAGDDAPGPGPWSPCSAAAGLTQAYLDHLARTEPSSDPAAEAELAYVVEQFHLSHAESGRDGRCVYLPLERPVDSGVPGHPHVGAYFDFAPSHGERDGPAGGILLVAAPIERGGFLERYRSLNRATALWWADGGRPSDALSALPPRSPAREALSRLLARVDA